MSSHRTVLAALLTAAMLAPGAAFAGDPGALLDHIPAGSGLIGGFDGDASRSSTAFSEGIKLVRRDRGARKALDILKKDLKFDIKKDLKTAIIGMPAIKGTGKRTGRSLTLVIDGNFDRDELTKRFASSGKPAKVSGLEVYTTKRGASVAFLSDTRLALVIGKEKYSKTAWSTVAGKTKGASSGSLAAKLGSIDTSSNAWVVADMSKARQPKGRSIKSLASTFDLSSGMKVDNAIEMGSGAQVDAAIAAFDESRFSSSMLAAAYALHPLVNNAKLSRKSSTLTVTTSMTDTEVRAVRKRIRELEEQQKRAKEEAKKKAEQEAKAAEAAP